MKHRLLTASALLMVASLVGVLVTSARADAELTPEQKAKAWLYVQGYKPYPHNYCRIIVSDKDNQKLCNTYRDYDMAHDKDHDQKYYLCTKGWDCSAVVDPK